MFADQLLLVDVFSQLYYPLYYITHACQKTTIADFRYESLKSRKHNIDLTRHVSLSIFTDFRY